MKSPIKFQLIILSMLLPVFFLLVYFIALPLSFDDSFVTGDPEAQHLDIMSVVSFGDEYSAPTNLDQFSCDDIHEIEYLYYEELPENPVNNKFGLYVYAEVPEFIRLAADMVNSNGGEWGYVLIPYNVHDNDKKKWERVFASLIERKLIPVIKLNDVDVENYKEQTEEAAKFLDSFVWPVKERYISVYNEPNDARFWYGRVAPAEYAEILDFTIDTFKNQNRNFFIMNGALNVSAAPIPGYMDAFDYLVAMDEAVPGIFSNLDGWASHPYPQPAFSGSPLATGRNSIRAYEVELDFLKTRFGVTDLPVFITETGWKRAEAENYNAAYLSEKQVAENFKVAYEKVWLPDDRVVAVMPFTIWYAPPHDHFSWVNRSREPYQQYYTVQEMPKVKGTPSKLVKGVIYSDDCD